MMKNDHDNSYLSAADRYSYDGKLGAVFSPEKTIFRVWQPRADNIILRLYKAKTEQICTIKMKRRNGVFECEKTGCCDGLLYDFLVTRNGETVAAPDPYAHAVTSDGKFGIVVDMEKNKPDGWDDQPRITSEDPVIYELSARDFSMDENANFKHRGKFSAFLEKKVTNSRGDAAGIGHLKALGITHVQLMPVFDFDFDGCEYNWGYNPRFYNAPSNYYARENAVSELRELVHTLHNNGIGVVFDVVYNHMYSAENSAFGRIFPGYYFRHDKDGGYSNGSGCGNEFASERAMASKFIIDSLEYIAREYKADGFRFDLMGLLDIKTLKKAEQKLRKINPDILLYGEGWTGGKSALSERRRAVAKNASRLPRFEFFNDRFRDAVKGSVFDAEDRGYVNGNADEWHLAGIIEALTGEYSGGITSSSQAVNYVECHDNLTLFDKLKASMKDADSARIAAADRMAAALVMFSKGIAFISAGQEFLRSKGGDSNSYKSPDSVNSLKWDMITQNRGTVEYYKGLIALRRKFCGEFRECRVINGGDRFFIEYNNAEFFLIVNPADTAFDLDLTGDSEYEVFADKDRASNKALYTVKRLHCGEYSILFARRKRSEMNHINKLRALLKKRGIYAYIVPTDDFHGSEYVGEYFRLREYLSGFTGSAGTLLVTLDEALLWTDGRYFIQAAQQLEGSGTKLMKSGEKGVPTIAEYLAKTLPEGSVLGFDGRTVSARFAEELSKKLADKHITFSVNEDLGGEVWETRPPLSKKPVFSLPDEVCGVSRADKIERIRKKLLEENADSLIVSALDEIAWTLNLRGGDVDYNPVFLAFMIIEHDKITLFSAPEIYSENIKKSLQKDGVFIHPYDDVYNAISALNGTIWLDSGSANCRMKNNIKNTEKIIDKKSPIILMKSVKNKAEIEAEKNAHLKDGTALTRFMYWLKHSVGKTHITEISAAEKLEEFRGMGEGYLGQSFAPIMAYGEHGAIVHYSATEENNAELLPRGMLLSDTGGHYADGTTDVTRTFVLGELSEDERRAFTYVLAGHLELLRAVFPEGTRGSVLDVVARKPLWDHGMNFNHGTGHGVGFLLNVHEGPQRISYRAANDALLEAGMITSNEPGYYLEGRFGIRHESLILCQRSDMEGFLCFSPLTLVPFDLDGIDPELLTTEQRGYLNDYHALVYDQLAPQLPKEEAEWLKEVTKPI